MTMKRKAGTKTPANRRVAGHPEQRLLTVQEVAAWLACSPKTVRLMIREGSLKALRLRDGGTFHSEPADVEALIQKLKLNLSGGRR